MTSRGFHTLLKFMWIGMTVFINPEFVKIFIVDIVISQTLQSRGLWRSVGIASEHRSQRDIWEVKEMPFEWLCTLHFTCTSEKPCVDFRCLHVCGSRISLWVFALIVSHLKWKNVWNSWYQHGSVRTGRCSASTGHWKCFSWRGRWRRISSWGRRCGLDPVLRTKSYDRGWVSFWRSFPCGSQSCCHRTSAASTWKYCRCL